MQVKQRFLVEDMGVSWLACMPETEKKWHRVGYDTRSFPRCLYTAYRELSTIPKCATT